MNALSIADRLMKKWFELTQNRAKYPAPADDIFRSICAAYGDRSRRYHTLVHVEDLFSRLENAGIHDSACLWAVWFHDVVCFPGGDDNEARSAHFAEKALAKMGVDSVEIHEVVSLIVATQNHGAVDSFCGNMFLDADMAILGENRDVYERYRNNVRAEYNELSDQQFYLGRRAFLEHVLSRERIFVTNYFYRRYEEQARNNVLDELRTLIASFE